MRTLLFLIQKEFLQILRNKTILIMMTILPIFQLIVLSNAATNEVKEVKIILLDHDLSEISRNLTRKITASDHFKLTGSLFSKKQALEKMQANEADIILEIPNRFEKEFIRGEKPAIQMLVNAINGQQATVGSGYLRNIISTYSQDILSEVHWVPQSNHSSISISTRYWYNPLLKYTDFMVPGILAELTALLTIVLTAMNVVREREIGTIEQINVTPIKKWQFIMGKLIPFLCVGMFIMTVGLTVGKIIFHIPMAGSLILLFVYAFVNIIAVLGFGLLISNFADTQQQAIFVAFFFILIFILMSGLFTPIESMPTWAQHLTKVNPLAHFIAVSRKVLMKGSGFVDLTSEFAYTLILAIVFNVSAIWSYKKQE
ncbi:ABC transporter permease [Fulvivirga sp. 29W222]|uniref:ABC transporter permease n=1 Tax=Fulvivirga marina TaxID=2494733 RepID=A0A937G1I1_9BACT|nr:ABC transporter permease [Fulvivirga marina]MBL6448275.1 ABC transporter permease [Fulvivirga marina]